MVTPWRVRSPSADTFTACPLAVSVGRGIGFDETNVALGNWLVSRPSVRMRLSRRLSSLVSLVRSASNLASVASSALPDRATVTEPVTAGVRPTASLLAGRAASFSRTR